ncbi:MAG: methyltransferase domain-containing protein [Candidatus Gracilibacteria bacterium]|nr:methyltransferase domain-containing protein [Candidatus Gracilibacteria bacterium]
MTKYYNSQFYSKPIEVENISGEIIVTITDNFNRKIIYSWYDIVENNTQSMYINKCLLGGFIKKIPGKILIIGFGGGAFAKFLEDHVRNIEITGIDIDKSMIEIAKNELEVKTNDLYISDIFETLEVLINENKNYDLVLIDVYGADGEIPKYFEEKIFFEKVKKVLFSDGVLSINFSNYNILNQEKNIFYNKIHSNLISIFGEYYSHLICENDKIGNIAGIYNLDKDYLESDFNSNYIKNYKAGNIIYNAKILENTRIIKK